MWENIYNISLNLLLGVISGIFSSTIVSYIFLIDSEYKNQLSHTKELFEQIYGLVATNMAYEQFKESKGKKRAKMVTSIDDSGKTVGTVPIIDIMNNHWNRITIFYSNYEPWNYKYELGQILNNIYDIISDGKYLIRTSPEDYAEICTRFEKCIDQFETCQRNYKKEIRKRIFSNKLIRGMFLIFLCFLLLFIIA